MARGNARQDVFLDEADRELLIENPEGRLVSGMRRLNGAYTQDFNRRHGRVGHLSQATSVLIGGSRTFHGLLTRFRLGGLLRERGRKA